MGRACESHREAVLTVGWVEYGNLSHGALREPVENSYTRFQGLESVRNPPFSQRFAPRTLLQADGKGTVCLMHSQFT